MHTSSQVYRRRIDKVINYVTDHLDESISLDTLAEVAAFSPFHFHRVFTAITGESLNFFTNRLRLEKAARLIGFSNTGLREIGLECGFSSPATFSRSFKQYFGIAPSTYRRTGKIENSKICKELFPLHEYLVPMSTEEMEQCYPVTIKSFPKRRVAFIRITGNWEQTVVIEAFDTMIKWAKAKGIYDTSTLFGMSLDDAMVTPADKYRYEVCLTIPDSLKLDHEDDPATMELPSCSYATSRVSGDLSHTATGTYYLFNHWLINSKYEPEHQHGLEIFLDKEKACDWSHFELELCIPIKPIRNTA